jgi:hypothetical protein
MLQVDEKVLEERKRKEMQKDVAKEMLVKEKAMDAKQI